MSWEELPFDSKEDAIAELQSQGYDQEDAEKIANKLQEEAEMDEGQPKSLWESIKEGAQAIIEELGLKTFSWVENPAQRSKLVMMKGEENDFQTSTPILKEEEGDWETAYGPVMIPSETDKDGDVIPASVIKESAHKFMAEGKVESIDSDHDLITDKGTLVESWIQKEDEEYILPDGSTFEVPAGSWMVGVKPDEETKQRIKEGEITGFSIFGDAKKIKLKKSFKREENSNDTMSDEALEDLIEQVEAVKEELSEELSDMKKEISELHKEPEVELKEIETIDELNETVKELDETAEKEDTISVLDALTPKDVSSEEIEDAVGVLYGEKEEEEDEEEEDEEKEPKDKGADEESTRKEALEAKENTNSKMDYAKALRE